MIFKKTSALAQSVQKIDFWGSIWEGSEKMVLSNYIKIFVSQLSNDIKKKSGILA